MPQTVLIALHQQAVLRDGDLELSSQQANLRQRPAPLAVLGWLLVAAALVALLAAESFISPVVERLW